MRNRGWLRELSGAYAAIARGGREAGLAAAVHAVLRQIIAANEANTRR